MRADGADSDRSIVSREAAQAPLTSSGVIDGDLPCVECGYNLRALMYDHRCPECGRSIAESIAEYGNAQKMARTRIGVACVFGVIAIGLTLLSAYAAILSETMQARIKATGKWEPAYLPGIYSNLGSCAALPCAAIACALLIRLRISDARRHERFVVKGVKWTSAICFFGCVLLQIAIYTILR